MYRQLIGPYPYGKFALVENFWETGYGMPTFTLLGKEIIRFPFIINSSYPHEILHNWWGNSVFVDYETGNWCEGLTAYLADHLIQEQRGTGDEYRRSTLQKYRDYVKDGRDFPLTAFRSRESASTEAVGYGKALMAYHMLRLSIGDDTFRKVIARFYRDFKGKRASFTDFEKTAEAVSGRDFTRFFADWVGRAGAPVLAIDGVALEGRMAGGAVHADGTVTKPVEMDQFHVSGTLRQTQGGAPFAIDVPVVVQTASGVVRASVRMTGAEQSVRDQHAGPAADAVRRSELRRLQEARPARDAAVDRANLRRAADPCGAAVFGIRRRAAGVARVVQRVDEREPRHRDEAGHRGGGSAGGSSGVDRGQREPLRHPVVREPAGHEDRRQEYRDRRREDGAGRPHPGGDQAAPGERGEGDRPARRCSRRRPSRAWGGSFRTTASTRTSASKATSR